MDKEPSLWLGSAVEECQVTVTGRNTTYVEISQAAAVVAALPTLTVVKARDGYHGTL
jgi:hypothetical protein